jgi:TonB family protein
MNLRVYQRELAAIRARSRRTYVFSLGIHAVLVAWWVLHRTVAPDAEAITEITWIDEPLPQPVAVAAAVPAPPAVRPEAPAPEPEPRETPAPVAASPEPPPERRFPREMLRGETAPEPQSADAVQDRLNQRLASLKRGSTTKAPRIVTPVVASTLPGMAVPDPVDTARRPSPTSLSRGRNEAPAPVELRRSTQTPSAPVARRARVETPVASSPAMPARIDTTLQRTVAGASLVGPVADRPLESLVKPTYPEWAQRDAVEASVSLFFKVMADGRIKEPVLVQKTSGHRDFDRNAIRALLDWRFAPLGGGSGEQWGEITFHYRLHDTVQH